MLTILLLLAVAVPLVQVAPKGFTSGDPVFDLLTYGSVIGTTLALGAVKKYTTAADTWVGRKIKPVQPLVATVLGIALPLLIHGTPNVPDPNVLTVAPTATLLAVAAAEVLRRIVPHPAPFASIESRGGIGAGR